MKFNELIDHTFLKATATPEEIRKLCAEAKTHQFFSVCVNSCHVALAKAELAGSSVKVCTVVGFPLGAMAPKAKVFEAQNAIAEGADEVDMVLNVGWLKAGQADAVRDEVKALKAAVGHRVLKVILETCYLTDDEKRLACRLCVEAGADFVKTSTGFGTGGATPEDVKLMVEAVAGKALVKASGGVRDAAAAKVYADLGARRLGTSNGIAIVSGATGTGY
jgi:deoxyribose-phosphate aldolase